MNKIDEFIEAEIDRLEKAGEYVPNRLDDIAEKVAGKFNTSCVHYSVGDFDSPGYSVTYHAFAYVDEEGQADLYPYEHEMF